IEALIGELDLTSKGLQYGTKLNLQKLAREYEKMKESPNFIPNPDIEKKITRLDRKQIANMQIEDVRELIDVLRGIMHEIRNANKEIGVERAKNISDIVNKGIKETRASKGVGNNRLFTVFNTDSLTPTRKFAQLGGWHAGSVMESMGQQLNDGQHKQMEFTMKSTMHFENFVKKHEKAFDSWSGKNAKWVDSGVSKNGVMIKVTPEMRISMYLHSLNADNVRHIDGGGVRIPNMYLYKKGRVSEAYARGKDVKFTPSELETVVEGMTSEEKEFANIAYEFFNKVSKDAINETSLKLAGYEIATVDDYMPIVVDKKFAAGDFESLLHDGTIEGMGMLRERTTSSKPIVLEDITSVILRQIDNVAKYYGLAIP
ncbi:MAG: hypothetical protein RR504_07570, partial [Christensenellaceae bacterium]